MFAPAKRWSRGCPHQLRHNYATAVRKKRGIETAPVMLGHRAVDVTEIYAERDAEIGLQVAKAMG